MMNRVIPVLILLYFFTACSQPEKRKLNPKRFHAMLESYWQGLLDLQPLDAMHFGDSSRNDQFRNTCTQAYRDEVKEFYHQKINEIQHSFSGFEKVKKFVLMPSEFEITSGEITPTLKVKRNVVMKKYSDLIDKMYHN